MEGKEPEGGILQRKNELMAEITDAINELSNVKTLRQLAKENAKAQERSLELEKKAQVQEYRLEQASIKMKKIEEDDKDWCKKTAALLKEFEKKSGNGPFFESLLHILSNFQG